MIPFLLDSVNEVYTGAIPWSLTENLWIMEFCFILDTFKREWQELNTFKSEHSIGVHSRFLVVQQIWEA